MAPVMTVNGGGSTHLGALVSADARQRMAQGIPSL